MFAFPFPLIIKTKYAIVLHFKSFFPTSNKNQSLRNFESLSTLCLWFMYILRYVTQFQRDFTQKRKGDWQVVS